jgi:uncharacterized membrane protein YGL010W
MRTAQEWFDLYGESHQNPTNKAIHWVCVPVIFFCTIGLFWSIPMFSLPSSVPENIVPFVNWATILIFMATFFYLRLSILLSIGILSFTALCIFGNYTIAQSGFMPLWLFSLIVFIIAWIGQFVGHKIEGRKPSFFQDLQFLLIGPAWLMHFLYKKAGIPF